LVEHSFCSLYLARGIILEEKQRNPENWVASGQKNLFLLSKSSLSYRKSFSPFCGDFYSFLISIANWYIVL
jgi:hypothetical protein